MKTLYAAQSNERVKSKSGHDMYISYKLDNQTVFYDLFNVSDYDRQVFTPKKDCTLFRLHSDKTGSWPIVSINLDRSLIYFLKDYERENSDWETRGIKLDFDLRNSMETI